jgi:Tfp pilus assembly protein PilF
MNAEQYFYTANQLQQEGKLNESIDAYRHAIEIDPKIVKYYQGLGDTLAKVGELDEAVNCYQNALEVSPDNFLIYHRMGAAFERKGEIETALRYYQEALKINSNFGWSYFCLGNIYAEKGLLDQAVTFYQKACACHPKSPNFQFNFKLGEAFQKQGKLDKALDTYHFLLECDFKNTQKSLIYYKIGLVFSKQKKIEEAIATFIKALQNQPNNRQIYQELGEILLQQNQIDDSAKCFKNILPEHLLYKFHPSVRRKTRSLTADNNDVKITKVHSSYTVFYSPPRTLDTHLPFLLQRNQAKVPETLVASVLNGRAYLDGYNNVFISSDNQLLADLSIGNAELIISSDQLPTPMNIEGTVCSLVSPGAARIYYHWMVDLLPRIELVCQSGIPLESIDKFLVNRCQSQFQKETLTHLGISLDKIVETENNPHIKAEKIIIPWLDNSNGITAGKWIYDFLKRKFIVKDSNQMNSSFKKIYISRDQARYRKVVNEELVVNYLSTLGFKSIILESLSVVEQACLMSQAEAVIAPHGAGLTNLVFCPQGIKVIELFGKHLNPSYWAISNRCGLEYFSLFCDQFEADRSVVHSPEYQKNFLERNSQDIYVNIDDLSNLIKLSGLD